ncbi:MAG TPA: sulfite exporter TauE/SafE family protein [Chitinophagaceae bacterium]|jgi:uncharacterized membrane protein YfcA|nr:sulfite exporter TauE/SafE family protein [Chitinophagaceae bacterium]
MKHPQKQIAAYTEQITQVCKDESIISDTSLLKDVFVDDIIIEGIGKENIKDEKRWRIAGAIIMLLLIVSTILVFVFDYSGIFSIAELIDSVQSKIDRSFYWFIAVGFFAQMIDGVVGMGYGVTCTSLLMSMGVPPAAISSSVHTAEIFSSAANGYSHYRFGNVNKKLFKALWVPGVIGAVAGAIVLVWLGDEYAVVVKPVLAVYCLVLGIRILYQAYKKRKGTRKVKKAGWLAGAGGFLDSFGGGGWGPLVTSTLIAKGRSPQYVIGSVSLSEFFVTAASAFTFFALIGIAHWQVIVGLLIGSVVAAPLGAQLSGKLPLRLMLICVGIMVIVWSGRILFTAFY